MALILVDRIGVSSFWRLGGLKMVEQAIEVFRELVESALKDAKSESFVCGGIESDSCAFVGAHQEARDSAHD